jgi:hypothetical protein
MFFDIVVRCAAPAVAQASTGAHAFTAQLVAEPCKGLTVVRVRRKGLHCLMSTNSASAVSQLQQDCTSKSSMQPKVAVAHLCTQHLPKRHYPR